MKEQFYIDLRIREDAKKNWQEKLQNQLPKDPLDKSKHYCTDMNFPWRKCRPVIRRRTLAQVWELLEDFRSEN